MRKYLHVALLCLILIYGHKSFSQKYNTAAGLRLGSQWGLTVQQRLYDRFTMEMVLANNYSATGGNVDLTFQEHNPLLSRRLNFYYGAGPQIGWRNDGSENNMTWGLDLIGGAEFTMGRLNLSWDLTPTINLYNNDNAILFNSAVSVRYVVVKRKGKLFKNWQKKLEKRKKKRIKRKKEKLKEKNEKKKKQNEKQPFKIFRKS